MVVVRERRGQQGVQTAAAGPALGTSTAQRWWATTCTSSLATTVGGKHNGALDAEGEGVHGGAQVSVQVIEVTQPPASVYEGHLLRLGSRCQMEVHRV
jgi:hypothetical protein